MAKKKQTTDKISIKDVIAAYSAEGDNDVASVQVGNMVFTIRQQTSLAERADMVREIVAMCFTDDGEYLAYASEFAKYYVVLKHLTNINVNCGMETVWSLISNDGFTNAIYGHSALAHHVWAEADEMIDILKEKNLRKSKFDLLLDGLLQLMDVVRTKAENISMDDIAQYFPEVKDLMSKLGAYNTTTVQQSVDA